MFLDIANTDTIASTSDFRTFIESATPIRYAFWLSAIFVVIVSMLKYFVCAEAGKKDWIKLSLELPIDICALLLTLILSFFISKENLIFGTILFGISFLFIIIICVIRNKATSYYDRNRPKPTFGLLILECIIAFFWLVIVYNEML